MVGSGTDLIDCPFRNCTGSHEVHTDRSGGLYVTCDGWRQQAWLTRGPRGSDWLDEHNGGRLRANPPRIRKTNPAPKQDEMDRFLSGENEERKTGPDDDETILVETCPRCGKDCRLLGSGAGSYECPSCHFVFDVTGV